MYVCVSAFDMCVLRIAKYFQILQYLFTYLQSNESDLVFSFSCLTFSFKVKRLRFYRFIIDVVC